MTPRHFFLHPSLIVNDLGAKGLGMFCSEALEAGQVIEVSPVLSIDLKGCVHLNATTMRDYVFGWQEEGCGVALGYISLYNHSYHANCNYVKDFINQSISIETIRPIVAYEELCINYNGIWDAQNPVWFDAE